MDRRDAQALDRYLTACDVDERERERDIRRRCRGRKAGSERQGDEMQREYDEHEDRIAREEAANAAAVALADKTF